MWCPSLSSDAGQPAVWQRIAERGEGSPVLRDTVTWAHTRSPVVALTV